MDSTAKLTIDPNGICGTEQLLEMLLERVEFTAYPVDLIAGALMRASAVLDVLSYAEQQDAHHLGEAARSNVQEALAVVMAWDRQQRSAAR